VGIFGSVFNTGSFVFEPGHTTTQYLAQAGGPTRGADKDSIFMIRANGSVISARQGASFWHSGNNFNDAVVVAGDTIFVPEQVNKATFVQDAKDWTQILYQFGLALHSAGQEQSAREVWRASLDAFERIAARHWVVRVRQQLSGGITGRYL